MMVPLVDAQIRFLLLSHLATQIGATAGGAHRQAEVDLVHWNRLQTLSVQEFLRLVATRDLEIGVSVDGPALERALRVAPLIDEAEWLQTYFLTHGASWQLMRDLFRMRRKIVLLRRRQLGAWSAPGRLRLPDEYTRESIRDLWHRLPDADLRVRYYRLHQQFKPTPIRALEAVIRGAGARR